MKMADLSGRRDVRRKRALAIMLLANALAWTSFQAAALAQNYDGPLVDSHAHIVPYQSERQREVQYRVDARERASELTVADYVSSLYRNNIKCTVGFHAIAFDHKQKELLDHARRLLDLYPDRFVLFAEIFRHNPLDWFDATKLDPLLATGLFKGLGEIQFANEPLSDDETETPIVFPNDPRFLEIYDVLGDRGLFMMAHPASRQREAVDDAVSHDRRVTWIIHGPQVHGGWTKISGPPESPSGPDSLESLLRRNPNLYYTLDIAESLPEFLDLMKTEEEGAKEIFLAAMNNESTFNTLLDRMVSTWKHVIERRPNRFLWGTDMALPTWHWDPEVIDKIVEFTRAFIGRLDPDVKDPLVREKYAYKNAESLLGECKDFTNIPVPIDIKPRTINSKSRGKIPVAILSSPRFDPAIQVDVNSLTFGQTGDEASLAFCNESPEDANGDGLLDLLCHFYTENAKFQLGDKKGILKGMTRGGRTIEGRDWVRILEK